MTIKVTFNIDSTHFEDFEEWLDTAPVEMAWTIDYAEEDTL